MAFAPGERGQDADLDAFFAESAGVFQLRYTVDIALIGLAVMDLTRFLGEFLAHIVLFCPVDLGKSGPGFLGYP